MDTKTGLNENQLSELKEAFNLFDKDRNGTISIDELGTVLQALGQSPTDEELQMMMNSVDVDKNGVIDFGEFVDLMKNHLHGEGLEPNGDDEMLEAFKVFDKDGNGFITEEELRAAMISLGERLTSEELKMMIKAADTDGNGLIDYNEFVAMMKTK